MSNVEKILAAEKDFVTDASLAALMKQSRPFWRMLVPGMFFVDFFQRKKLMRGMTGRYLLPRQTALEAAQAMLNDALLDDLSPELELAVTSQLVAQGTATPQLREASMELVKYLATHYATLLSAKGDTFCQLVRHAYEGRMEYGAAIRNLENLEQAIDAILLEEVDDHATRQALQWRHQARSEQQERVMDMIFS